jgi:hypothetical protein
MATKMDSTQVGTPFARLVADADASPGKIYSISGLVATELRTAFPCPAIANSNPQDPSSSPRR